MFCFLKTSSCGGSFVKASGCSLRGHVAFAVCRCVARRNVAFKNHLCIPWAAFYWLPHAILLKNSAPVEEVTASPCCPRPSHGTALRHPTLSSLTQERGRAAWGGEGAPRQGPYASPCPTHRLGPRSPGDGLWPLRCTGQPAVSTPLPRSPAGST